VVGVCRERHRALMGLVVPGREMYREDKIACRVLRAECCRRPEAIRRTAAVPIREGPTEIRLDVMASLRGRAAMAGPATTAADTRDAVIRRQAGENRLRIVLVAEHPVEAAVHQARTEVPEAGAVDTAAVAEEVTAIVKITL
jgi:hypothetical protein